MHCSTAGRKQSHVTRVNQSQSDQPISSAQPITPRRRRKKKKKNLLTTTMQYTLAKENHITVVVCCRKGQRHQCRPPM